MLPDAVVSPPEVLEKPVLATTAPVTATPVATDNCPFTLAFCVNVASSLTVSVPVVVNAATELAPSTCRLSPTHVESLTARPPLVWMLASEVEEVASAELATSTKPENFEVEATDSVLPETTFPAVVTTSPGCTTFATTVRHATAATARATSHTCGNCHATRCHRYTRGCGQCAGNTSCGRNKRPCE